MIFCSLYSSIYKSLLLANLFINSWYLGFIVFFKLFWVDWLDDLHISFGNVFDYLFKPLLFLIWKLDFDGSPECYFSSFSSKTYALGLLYYFVSWLFLLLFWLILVMIDDCIWLFFWDLVFLLDPANDETCFIVSFS